MPTKNINTNTNKNNININIDLDTPKKKRRPRKKPSPPPQEAYAPAVPQLPGQPQAFKITAYTPRPITFAPSTQMIQQEGALGMPYYFEKMLTNQERTMEEVRKSIQNDIEDMRNEMMANAQNQQHLGSIASAIRGLQRQWESELPPTPQAQSSSIQGGASGGRCGGSSGGDVPPSFTMPDASAYTNPMFDEDMVTASSGGGSYAPPSTHHSVAPNLPRISEEGSISTDRASSSSSGSSSPPPSGHNVPPQPPISISDTTMKTEPKSEGKSWYSAKGYTSSDFSWLASQGLRPTTTASGHTTYVPIASASPSVTTAQSGVYGGASSSAIDPSMPYPPDPIEQTTSMMSALSVNPQSQSTNPQDTSSGSSQSSQTGIGRGRGRPKGSKNKTG